ncbi:unnamed protein product [Porites evermanni]|uniref:Uncharacterized protein n=1 Tax=Porites evermanni TaxID=104178 RepID=A0ABN8PJ89_9CNID|nr:unnamed protein product [Porites evermanni]
MRKSSEIHAPGLFDVLLSSILRDDSRLSEDRKTLQEQRTDALLHIKHILGPKSHVPCKKTWVCSICTNMAFQHLA